MKNNKNFAQAMLLFFLGLALIIVYKAFDSLGWIWSALVQLFSILTPFVVGFGIAFVLYGPVTWFENLLLKIKGKFFQRAARPIAVVITYLLTLALLAGLVVLVLPPLLEEVSGFIQDLLAVDNLSAKIEQYIPFLQNVDLDALLLKGQQVLTEYFTFERIVGYIGSVWRVTSSLIDVVMAVIVSIYMLLGRESLLRAVKSVFGLVFKPRTMSSLSGYSHKIAKIFYSYLYSQFLDALVVGVLATVGFGLVQILPFGAATTLRLENFNFGLAATFGMTLGLLNMIPYFGALIGGVVFSVIVLLSENFAAALFIAIYIVVMQQIDANIIQPRIIGENVGIRAIYVLLGITIFGGLLGFWGIFFGAPFMAVIQLLLTDYIRFRKQKAATPVSEESDDPPTEE